MYSRLQSTNGGQESNWDGLNPTLIIHGSAMIPKKYISALLQLSYKNLLDDSVCKAVLPDYL